MKTFTKITLKKYLANEEHNTNFNEKFDQDSTENISSNRKIQHWLKLAKIPVKTYLADEEYKINCNAKFDLDST